MNNRDKSRISRLYGVICGIPLAAGGGSQSASIRGLSAYVSDMRMFTPEIEKACFSGSCKQPQPVVVSRKPCRSVGDNVCVDYNIPKRSQAFRGYRSGRHNYSDCCDSSSSCKRLWRDSSMVAASHD